MTPAPAELLLSVGLGVAVGALLPVVVYRWSVPIGQTPRTDCRHCYLPFRRGLSGWVKAGSRCRRCQGQLGPRWPLLSAVLALASALLAWRLPAEAADDTALLVAWLMLASAGVTLAAIDITVQRLPTPLIAITAAACLLAISVATVVSGQPRYVLSAVAASCLLGGAYHLLALTTSGMGAGDVRLAALLGLCLGPLGWDCVLLGAVLPYLLAAPVAAIRVLRDPGRADPLPFGPYLVAGAILATF